MTEKREDIKKIERDREAQKELKSNRSLQQLLRGLGVKIEDKNEKLKK